MMRKLLILVLVLLLLSFTGRTQSLTNLGTDFWIAFPRNNTLSAQLKIFISSDLATSGMVTSAFPGVNQGFNVVPGIVTELSVPSGIALTGGIEDKAIHITSAGPVAVYGLNWETATTDAYMALPVPSLGTDYRILTYETTLNGAGSCFSVVATQDGTVLNIFNHQTNGTSVVNLNQGQTYHIEAPAVHEDLTGSTVQSNFPVSVFVSVDITNITFGCTFADHIVEQLWPLNSWGKDFVTVPTAGRDNSGDIFRIIASEDNTDVSINGSAVATLNAGDFYESNLTGFNVISATKPSCLAQYAKGTNCSGGATGDPFMMLIPPREQFLTGYTVTTVAGFTSHWVNIAVPDYGLGTILMDGVPIPAGMFTPIGTSGFFGAQQAVSEGSHVFSSNVPFGVFVYGWTNVNSYGYPGGGSMSPVATVTTVTLSPDTLNGILNVSSLCFTAHVTDQYGDPVAGVLVTFYVSGIGPFTGTAYTDIGGLAQFCYTQTGILSGTDYIYAEVSGHTSDSSVANWLYIPPCTNPSNGGTIGNSQSGCGSYTPDTLAGLTPPVGYSGTLEFLWQISTFGPSSGFTDITGSDNDSLFPAPIVQTTWYRRLARVDCMPDWTGAAESNVIEATVMIPVLPSVSISVLPATSCPGTLVTFTATTVNGGPSPSYQWQVNGFNVGPNSPVYAYVPLPGDSVRCVMTSSLPCVTNNPVSGIWHLVSILPAPATTFVPCFDTITITGARPLKLKGGIPVGGTYSGTGVTGGYYYPASGGTGIHAITYSYTNSYLCSATAQASIHQAAGSSFTCGQPLTDIRDGKSYPTVMIGTQCWMASDLNFGIQIPESNHQRDNCIPEKYNRPSSLVPPPSFYQWEEMMEYENVPGAKGICPPGWHVPTEAEWNILYSNWTNNAFAAAPLKYSGYSGFNALLSGARHQNVQWNYQNFALFHWSSDAHGRDKAWAHGMNDFNPSVSLYPSLKSNAFSVRCTKD